MTLLKQFLELGLDCSPIGLGPGPSQGGYFCTPKGMTVLGWEGVDGIHYGRIRGYGDMVFAVNPMPAGEQHVRPLAGSFRDFLPLSGGAFDPYTHHGWQHFLQHRGEAGERSLTGNLAGNRRNGREWRRES